MTIGSGYGAGGWGGMPWGSARFAGDEVPDEFCDLMLFEDESMQSILTHPDITTFPNPSVQFVLNYPDATPPPWTTKDLGILSGDTGDGGFPTTTAYISNQPSGIDSEFTVEAIIDLEALPTDFTDVVNNHFAFGATDASGPCGILFISKVGLAYAGGIHHAAGELVVDTALDIIPATAPLITEGETYVIRVALSEITGATYIYLTLEADLASIGHQLVAVMPVYKPEQLDEPPIDQAIISVSGTTLNPTRVALDRWCLSSQLVIPDIVPVANAGQDQAVRLCSIAQFDGSASLDPEGATLVYEWRLIDAPGDSSFAEQGVDGETSPLGVPTGFTDRFYSDEAGLIHDVDAFDVGDVLLVDGEPRSIVTTGVDGGFYLLVEAQDIPDDLAVSPFKVLRQRGVSDADTVSPTFFPDVAGFYKFDLQVYDGNSWSDPSVVILNVLESVLPRGCTPNTDFLFNYLSDFWRLVEDAEKLSTLWSALAQVTATEMFTLWQYEYNKSIRDIQRTVARRWLHYDLILAEPLPELTTIRTVWSGVSSSLILNAGDGVIPSSTLVLTSDSLETDFSYTFNGSTPEDVYNELSQSLSVFDTRFSVELITNLADTGKVVRINALFPFEVSSASTVPVYTVGDTSGLPTGTSGVGSGVRAYNTRVSLQGLGIQEDDLLVLDGIAYRISHVVTDAALVPTDTYPQQRLVLKDALPTPPATTWSIASVVSSELLDFYNGMVSRGDTVYFEVTLLDATFVSTTALGACEANPGRLPIDPTPIGTALADEDTVVYLAKVVRRTYLPVDELVVDLPTLQEHIVIEDDEATLRRNLDFFLENYRAAASVRFVSGLDGLQDVWEGADPPDRLWAEYTYIDNNPTIEANFGLPAEFTLDDLENLPQAVDYLSAVRGLWYAYFNGPTLYNIRVGAQILLGLPFAEEAGTIEEIRTDFSPSTGRILVRDTANTEIVRSYVYPRDLELEVNPDTGVLYSVGDTVKQFAPLVEGVEITDYVKEPDWFVGLMNQGSFHEVEKYFKFRIRVDSAIFDIDSVGLVRDFALRIKPTYTYPLFIVRKEIGDTDIDITDTIFSKVRLRLADKPCCCFYGTMQYDDPRPGGYSEGIEAGTHDGSNDQAILTDSGGGWVTNELVGYYLVNSTDGSWGMVTSNTSTTVTATLTGGTGDDWDTGDTYVLDNQQFGGGGYWNHFDTDDSDLTVPPTQGGGPDDDIIWGYDKSHEELCPDDQLTAFVSVEFAGGIPQYDMPISFDEEPVNRYGFEDDPPGDVLFPAGLTLTQIFGGSAPATGTLTDLKVVIVGGLGGEPDDYEIEVVVNSVVEETIAFTALDGLTTVQQTFGTPIAITASQPVGLVIKSASGSATRSPAWTFITAYVDGVSATMWAYDVPLPAGTYFTEIPLL